MRLLPAVTTALALAAPASAAQIEAHVLEIRPTQFAVGMVEVQSRVDKLSSLGRGELQDYLEKHPVPVVVGPGGDYYMVDHHHLVRAAWEAGIHKVNLEQRADYSRLPHDKFWEKMHAESLIYPYDQFGSGPHSPGQLPNDVRGLADDPFRSLAWRVRDEGGYDKNAKPFSEFQWAEFFRKNLRLDNINDNFDEAVKQAMSLAASPDAAHLPGYKGKAKP